MASSHARPRHADAAPPDRLARNAHAGGTPDAGRDTDAAPRLPADQTTLLGLQRTAGNRAVSDLLATQPRGVLTVQRHNSYEHALMGDTRPSDLQSIASSIEGKVHAVAAEKARMAFFQPDAGRDPRREFPDIRWVQLKASKLWVSSGEITALADYLPDPATIDAGPRSLVEPVLQKVRHEITKALDRITIEPTKGGFKGEASTWMDKAPVIPADAKAVHDVDEATARLGPNRQQGLLARNACHFAPYSWERWALFHNQAREEAARQHAATRGRVGGASGMLEHERLAWVNNGYANHFLQDSFAAGHLLNKTLVMQWFVEYLGKRGKRGRMFDPALARDMTEAAQPGLAHRNLYKGPRLHTTAEQDRASGMTPVDPQTDFERRSGKGRLEGSGVSAGAHGRAFAYHEYGELLNDSYVSMAANNAHDFLNHMGLIVHNTRGDRFKVGGDGSFLMLSDETGLRMPIEADELSDRAISETLATGKTSIDQQRIFDYFPISVEPVFGVPLPGHKQPKGPIALEQWNDTELRRLCWEIIFPAVENFDMKLLRAISPRLIENPERSALPT